MLPFLAERSGNPSSLSFEGREARSAIDMAREVVSGLFGCAFGEVTFTSSGTEAVNLAILGAALANTNPGRDTVLLSSAEHHAALHCRPILERLGYHVRHLPVDAFARVYVNSLPPEGSNVLLVSAMHANNELGTLQPVKTVSAWARRHGVLFHCDAVQTFGWSDWTAESLGADLVSVAAHKCHGPKGAGALYIRAGVKLQPLAVGGAQERELRAGTENVAGIVGFGAALQALKADVDRLDRKRQSRDRFIKLLPESQPTVPAEIESLSGHAHLRFPGISAESLLILLDRLGVSASSGAACSSGSLEPSHVMLAAGYSEAQSKEAVRFSFGKDTTLEDAEAAASIVREAVSRLTQAAV